MPAPSSLPLPSPLERSLHWFLRKPFLEQMIRRSSAFFCEIRSPFSPWTKRFPHIESFVEGLPPPGREVGFSLISSLPLSRPGPFFLLSRHKKRKFCQLFLQPAVSQPSPLSSRRAMVRRLLTPIAPRDRF